MNSYNPKIQRYIKEGRGQGQGKDYIPWVKTSDYSSKGRATRIQGIKTKRIHHLHSDNQLRAFLIFEYNDSVVDIRESYPLLDVMEVIDEKEQLRFDKFTDEAGNQLVICTNFLLTVKNDDDTNRLVARTIKNTTELNRKITLEKLEIERRYWSAKGIDWRIITEKQLSRQLCKNIEWIRETRLATNIPDKDELAQQLLIMLRNNSQISLKTLLNEFENEMRQEIGTGLFLYRYLIAKKYVEVNLGVPINLNAPIVDIIL